MRGAADFSAARLLSQLRPWDAVSAWAGVDELDNYRRFYGFTRDSDHGIGTIESCGQSIVVQAFVPEHPRGTALVVHGYYDHVGLFVYLIEYLLSKNLAVVSCDLPGHGLSSGDRVTIDSFDTYVRVIRDVLDTTTRDSARFPAPLHVFGQSMGGSVVMELVEQEALKGCASVVLLAPLVYPWNWALNRWVYRLARLFVKTRPRGRGNPTDQPEFQALRAVDPLQAAILPVSWVTAMVQWARRFEAGPLRKDFAPLVVQGLADRVVDWPFNLAVLRRRYSPRVLEIEGATHHLVNETPRVRALMWTWFDEQLPWRRDA